MPPRGFHCAPSLVLTLILTVAVQLYSPISHAQENEAAGNVSDVAALKSPIPYSKRSIARGKMMFRRMCIDCHGPDGKAQMDVIADATNLTNPVLWRNGTKEGEIFRSIRDGAGEMMPPYKTQIRNEEDLWHLVHFIQSLWPKSRQPPLEEESAGSDSKENTPTKAKGADNE